MTEALREFQFILGAVSDAEREGSDTAFDLRRRISVRDALYEEIAARNDGASSA